MTPGRRARQFGRLQTQLGIGFAVPALVTVALLVASFHLTSRTQMRQAIRERLHDAVGMAALQVDAGTHSTLTRAADEGGPAYMLIQGALQRIRDTGTDIRYVYTMREDEEGRIVFVVDAETVADEIAHLGDIYDDASDKLKGSFATLDGAMVEDGFYTDQWGTWLSGYAPFYGPDGRREGVLGMDIAAAEVIALERRLLWAALAILAVSVPVAPLAGWLLGRRLALPITTLTASVERIAGGDLSHRAPVPGGNELGELAVAFNNMTGQLSESLEDLRTEVAERLQTDKALRESEERYRGLFEGVPVGIYRSTTEGDLLDVNPAMVQMLGYPDRESLLGGNTAVLYVRPKEREKWRDLAEGGGIVATVEQELVRHDGASIWVSDTARIVRDQKGQVQYYEGILEDITKRKRDEAELRIHRDHLEKLVEERTVQVARANERLQGEAAERRKSAARYRSLFENSPVSLWEEDFSAVKRYIDELRESGVSDLRAYLQEHPEAVEHCAALVKVLDVNQATLELFEAEDKEAFLSGGLNQIFGEGARKVFEQELIAHAGGKTGFESRNFHRTLAGDSILTSIRVAVAPGHEETWARLLVSMLDITDRVQAENEIRASRERFGLLVENMPVMIDALDEKGVMVLWNRECERVTGYSAEEIVGNPQALELLYPDRDRLEPVVAEVADHVSDFRDYEWEIESKDGGSKTVSWANISNQVPIPGWSQWAIGVDVTERVRAESERDATLEALRELNATLETQVVDRTAEIRAEQEKSETILRSVGDAIAMTDLERRIRFVNDAFSTLTGYSGDDAAGQPMSAWIGEELPASDWEALASSLTRGEVWRGEVTARRKDGRTYDADLTIAPVSDAKGRLVGHVSSHRDISRLKDLDRARDRFMNNVSHELRTPVTNIKLYAQLLRSGRRPEKSDHYLEVMTEQVQRLEHLVRDILELTDLDRGRATMVMQPVRLSAMIGDSLTAHQRQATAAGLTLGSDPLPAGLPAVMGDQARLSQALSELMENAITFTLDGGEVAVAAGTAEREGERWVTIDVRDSGVGIPPPEQERVFDRFYRGSAAASGHVPGAGLGLSIVREIMRAHGGRVTVESTEGEGSTFTLWLRAAA